MRNENIVKVDECFKMDVAEKMRNGLLSHISLKGSFDNIHIPSMLLEIKRKKVAVFIKPRECTGLLNFQEKMYLWILKIDKLLVINKNSEEVNGVKLPSNFHDMPLRIIEVN